MNNLEESPENLVKQLIEDERSRTILQKFITDTLAPAEVCPAEAIPLEYVKDVWTEFSDRLDPKNVPWCDVSATLVDDMTRYLKSMCRFGQHGERTPTTKVIITRLKRYYRARRQQLMTADSEEKRRRRRFQNKTNRLTMEKRDREIKKAQSEGMLEGLSNKELKEKRLVISSVSRKNVIPPADSDDEENKMDLLCRRRLFLKKARSVATSRRMKARALLEAAERPGSGSLHVKDLLEIAKANEPVRAPQAVPSPPKEISIVPETPQSSQEY